MSYEDNLKATKQKLYLELFEFNAQGVITRYTTHKVADVIYQGATYKRARIKRNNFVYNTKIQSSTLSIDLPLDENSLKYVGSFPITDIRVTVIGLFPSGEFAKILFKGTIIDASIQNNTTRVIIENSTEIFRDPYPNLAHTAYCNHQLFNSGCALLESSYLTDITVEAVNGATITSSSFSSPKFGSFPVSDPNILAAWWIGGQARLSDGTDARLITNYNGTNQITLQVPFDSRVSIGSIIKCLPGDDRSGKTCRDKFNNLGKFLGMPYIPNTNPVIFSFK